MMACGVGTVVVGMDGSDSSIRALRWALDESDRPERPVHVVMASGQPDLYGSAVEHEDGARADLGAAVEKALDGDRREVVQHVYDGHPVPVLIAAAHDARLLVVGSRGMGGFRGMRVGSVSTHLAGHTRCPMVLVPDDPE